jgi:hypothetical protein
MPKQPRTNNLQGERVVKNAAAMALGRLGGLKGGKARAQKLSSERRSEIARLASLKRWKKPLKRNKQPDAEK